jgi:hypothetical protein
MLWVVKHRAQCYGVQNTREMAQRLFVAPGSKFKSRRFNSICELYIYTLGCQASGAKLLVGLTTYLGQTELLIEADCGGSNGMCCWASMAQIRQEDEPERVEASRRLKISEPVPHASQTFQRQRGNPLFQAFTVPGLPFSTTNEARVLIGSSGFVTAARMRKSVCHRLGLTSQRT